MWLGRATGQSRPFLWAAFGAALSGFASAMVVVPVRSVVQAETPPEQIARVTALGEALNTTALLTAPFAGAALASLLTIGTAFLAGGIMMVIVAVFAARLHLRRAP